MGRKSSKCLESPGEVIGSDESIKMRPELFVIFVVIAFNGGLLERAVHTLDLAVSPGMVGLGEAVLNALLTAQQVECRRPKASRLAGAILRQIAALDALVGQYRVDGVGHCLDEGC